MAKLEAKLAVGKILQSGFRHHAYDLEAETLHAVLVRGASTAIIKSVLLELYADMLGPDPMRSVKNGMICLLTVVSRAAIDYGADSEYSFALSDYYIEQTEKAHTMQALQEIYDELLESYQELVADSTCKGYSPPIAQAVKHIRRHMYSRFTVTELAEEVGFSPPYFSRRFKKEIGVPPREYIERCRLDEAHRVLVQGQTSVLEIAEALDFCSASYFAHRYKLRFGVPPSQSGGR